MNSFEAIGESMVLAAEGQREIARHIARAVSRAFGRRSEPRSK